MSLLKCEPKQQAKGTILQYIKGAEKYWVCMCLQSEWLVWGLPSRGHMPGGTVSGYSTGIPRVV